MDSVSAYSLYAPFDTFFVTYTTNTVTTGSSPPAGGTTSGGGLVNCGSNVTVCATPNACYNFLYWSQNGSILSTSACHSFSVTGNEAVVANFVNGQGSLATDNAADPVYASGSWTNSLNGGSGFGPWILLESHDERGLQRVLRLRLDREFASCAARHRCEWAILGYVRKHRELR